MPQSLEAPCVLGRNVLPNPSLSAQELRRILGPHPVPQSDPRTRGLLVEMSGSQAHRERLQRELPVLAEVLQAVGDTRPAAFLIAVNETPPTDPDSFLMMPHVDRRFSAAGFTSATPQQTTVVVLDFPPQGTGGELVVFTEEGLRDHSPTGRSAARDAVARARGLMLPPVPGTAYTLPGAQPHAVLGYSAPPGSPWRMVAVIAEFAGEEVTHWHRLG